MNDLNSTQLPRRVPRVGDHDVKYDGFDAILIAVANPSDPDSAADLVYTDSGRRRIATNVRRALAPGCWAFVGDVEAARPLSPMEAWAIAKQKGELVPEVGARIVFGNKPYLAGGIHQVVPLRATITAVHSLDLVDLITHEVDPPEDPEQPEKVTGRRSRVPRATGANSYVAKGGFYGHWDWPGGLVAGFDAVPSWTVYPPATCTRCTTACKATLPLSLGETSLKNPLLASLCEGCQAELRQWVLPASRDDNSQDPAEAAIAEVEARIADLVDHEVPLPA